jgi:hypothetical protein
MKSRKSKSSALDILNSRHPPTARDQQARKAFRQQIEGSEII